MEEFTADELYLGHVAYRNMGLIGNPFKPFETNTDPVGAALVEHAAAARFVATVVKESQRERSRPVWVDKDLDVHESYLTAALIEVLRTFAREGGSLFGVYVPLEMFRLGRIRGVLSTVADNLSARQFDLTLAAWLASVLSDPDTELPEYAAIATMDLRAIVERLQTDPSATVAEFFGACEVERKSEEEVDARQLDAYAAENVLDRDPAEADDSSEVEGLVLEPGAAELEPVSEDAEEKIDPVAAYAIAYARARLSPVIARALKAYLESGTSAVSEQLKITKAPKKTLKAVVGFAGHRFARIVLIFDHFDSWESMDDQVRAIVLGTLSELRWVLGDNGTLALLVRPGIAPELEEQFAASAKITWDLPGLIEMYADDAPLDVELAQSWLDAAAIVDPPPYSMDRFAAFVEASDGLVAKFAPMAAAAIDDAACRGVSTVDDAAMAVGLAAGSE